MKHAWSLLFLSFLVFGCLGSQQPTPTPTAQPTAAPTLAPTATPEASATPLPSPTETLVSSPTPLPTLPASCLFDTDCGPQETCNIALGVCEALNATPRPTTSPSPTPTLNETERLQGIVAQMELEGNRFLATFSEDYTPFKMRASDYDAAYLNPREYNVEHLFRVPKAVGEITFQQDVKFGAHIRREPLLSVPFSRRTESLENRRVYVDLHSDNVPGAFRTGNSSAFSCFNNTYRVFVFLDQHLYDALKLAQPGEEPILYATRSLLGICPA